MRVHRLFAVVCVSDLERSVEWYGRLFGRDADARPMDGLAEWHHGEGSGLQLVQDAEKAGRSLLTVVTPSLLGARRDLSARRLDLGPSLEGDFGVLAQMSDPDGNRITVAEPPRGGG